MIDSILKELREQLARYEDMARKEKEDTGGETYGTCAYLDGAVVASKRAVEIVERSRAKVGWVTQEVRRDRLGPPLPSIACKSLILGGRGES